MCIRDRSCEYRQLARTEQQLVDVLLQRADEIHELGSSSRKLDRQGFHNNYRAWADHLQRIALASNNRHKVKPALPVHITPQQIVDPQNMRAGITARPLAAGRSQQQYHNDVQTIMDKFEIDDLSPILFPGMPAGTNTLDDALTNLVYQLQ